MAGQRVVLWKVTRPRGFPILCRKGDRSRKKTPTSRAIVRLLVIDLGLVVSRESGFAHAYFGGLL